MEDICLPRKPGDGALSWCVRPTCTKPPLPNRACPEQTLDFATITPGRSMVHMDSTYFIAQALGYRADVAYWIAAYNEVSDFTHYVPIDQCGVQAANETSIASGTTKQTNGMVVHWPKGIEEKVACTRSSRTSSTSLTRSG